MYYGILTLSILLLLDVVYRRVYRIEKKRAREICLVAILAALAVVGNLVSLTNLPLQLGTAMVIITGISMGPENGFLVGSLGRFVCNFFQGQGPWTPWQMVAWGLLGLIAGFIFQKMDSHKVSSRSFKLVLGPITMVVAMELVAYITYLFYPFAGETTYIGWRLYAFGALGLLLGFFLLRKKLPVDEVTITVYTFFAVFIIYGGIMNLCALFSYGSLGLKDISFDSLRALYLSGVPYDFYHAFRASVAVLCIGPAMIRRLERVKIKYGFYRNVKERRSAK